MQSILIVSEESLDKLSAMADKIMEMTPRSADLAEGKKNTDVDELLAKISRNSRDQRHYSIRNRNRSRSRKRYDPNGKFCFYHFKFGTKCHPEKCVQPCNWKVLENHATQ